MNNYIETIQKNIFPCILRPYKKSNNKINILLIVLGVFFIADVSYSMYFNQLPIVPSLVLAIKKSIMFIISFYIMQELEPDMSQNYPLAILLAGLSLFLSDITNILGLLLILFCARILSRTSGFKVSLPELVLVLMISLYLFLFSSYTYALMCTLALAIDYYMDKQNKKSLPFLIAIGTISILGFLRSLKYLSFMPRPNLSWIIILIVIALIFALRISFIKTIYSANDMNLKALSPKRIKALNAIVLFTLFVESFAYGNHLYLISTWALVLGLSLPYIKDIKKVLK